MSVYKKGNIGKSRRSTLPITPGNTMNYARVLKTVLVEDSEEYNRLGKSQSLCGVLYRLLGDTADESRIDDKNFALPFFSNERKPPIPGEIVMIVNAPGTGPNSAIYNTTYYIGPVAIWNHPHLNVQPDETQESTYFDGENLTIEGNFEEIGETVNPLELFQGDYSIEGRSGNSIRFGGVTNTKNINITSQDKMSPYLLIRNGRFEKPNGLLTGLEDINSDDASIYMTSNHRVNLEPSIALRNTYKTEATKPPTIKSYLGNQVIIASGRIILNSNKDLMVLSSIQDMEIRSKRTHIESEEFVAFDSKKVYLGAGALEERNPVLLGEETVDWLKKFVLRLKKSFTRISNAGPDARPFIAATIKEMAALSEVIEPLAKELDNVKSKKTFVE